MLVDAIRAFSANADAGDSENLAYWSVRSQLRRVHTNPIESLNAEIGLPENGHSPTSVTFVSLNLYFHA